MSSQRPKAYKVILQDANGVFRKVGLTNNPMNEVILSAGAMGSPHLLMLRGVGPMPHLVAHGIKPVVLDHPMIGQGMGDNPMNPVIIPSPTPVETSTIQSVGITKFDSYIEGGSNVSLSYDLTRRFFDGVLNLLNETSHTASTKFFTQSIADFLKSLDIGFKVMGWSKKLLDRLQEVTWSFGTRIQTIILRDLNAFSKYKYPGVTARELLNVMLGLPTNLRPRHVTSTFNLKQYCIDTVMSIWHYHGGCQVGSAVDKNYKVLGIDALRVIDGSTFLKSPGTNPQATVMMLGRYMGQKILQERAVFHQN
ncbi:unnamed protein product [Thlaspi arvense]|uniref:Glucose-methanol-choline oxidoreductase C-terminal domain-containing protein n=1 Tax=Thlaspi arvense TaxID=13288 RepID=A0AAU9STX5_THLAR|nr:unnamed protein product [Thlaspi arvense]